MTVSETHHLSDDQLLRIEAVAQLTTLSKSCISLWVAQDKFPKPVSLSKTVKVWRMRDVRSWTQSLFDESEESIHA